MAQELKEKDEKVFLRKQLGILDCISLCVGIIVGSGIFISPKGILANTGTVGWSFVVWILCGVMSCVGALCYAELGTSIHISGGDYSFLRIVHKLLGFLRMWTMLLAVRTVPFTLLSLVAAKYTMKVICEDCPEDSPAVRLITACYIGVVIFINCWSVPISRKVQIVFTAGKLMGLTIIIISGLIVLMQGRTTSSFENLFNPEKVTFHLFPNAFYSGMFAYSGWQYLPQVTEEIINPKRTMPVAIISSLALVTGVYLLTNVAYFAVLTPQELLASDAVAVTFGKRVLGGWWWVMPLAVAMSCIGSVNGGIFSTSRMFFVASREGDLPDILGMVHIKKRTPLPAAAVVLPICLFMLITDDVYALINYLSFSRWLFIAITTLAVPYFRWKYPALPRSFKVPLILPIIFAVCAFFMVFSSVISAPVEFCIGLGITLAGIPVYFVCVWWDNKPETFQNRMKSMTIFLQKLLYVIPQEVKTYDCDLVKRR